MKRWSKRLQDKRLSLARPAACKPCLPHEIVDIIIDLVHLDSTQSLSDCALVCKAWVPRVRYHQFTTLIIPGYLVKEFVKLLASPLSSLSECIVTLQIGTEDSRWRPSRSIYTAISGLRRLQTLKLRHFDVVTKRMAELGPLRDICPHLRVEVYDGSFCEDYQYLQMLGLFWEARALEFPNAPFFAIEKVPKTCLSFRMTGTWRLEFGVTPNFVEWMCLQDPSPSIEFLTLTPPCGPAGGRLLKIVGASLTDFKLILRKFEWNSGYGAPRHDKSM
jgi:hypothetical protein